MTGGQAEMRPDRQCSCLPAESGIRRLLSVPPTCSPNMQRARLGCTPAVCQRSRRTGASVLRQGGLAGRLIASSVHAKPLE